MYHYKIKKDKVRLLQGKISNTIKVKKFKISQKPRWTCWCFKLHSLPKTNPPCKPSGQKIYQKVQLNLKIIQFKIKFKRSKNLSDRPILTKINCSTWANRAIIRLHYPTNNSTRLHKWSCNKSRFHRITKSQAQANLI